MFTNIPFQDFIVKTLAKFRSFNLCVFRIDIKLLFLYKYTVFIILVLAVLCLSSAAAAASVAAEKDLACSYVLCSKYS